MSEDAASPLLVYIRTFRKECGLKDRDCLARVAYAAHENIDRRKVALRPGVDRDMTFRQNNDTRHAAIRCEMVEMTVQDSGTCRHGALAEHAIDQVWLIEISSSPEIDEKVRAGKLHAVLLNKIIRSFLSDMFRKRDNFALAIAREIRDHPQLSKCVHHVPPNQQMTCWAFAPLGREA